MKELSKEEFIELLKNTEPCEIELITNTDPKLRKRGNPFVKNEVIKRTEGKFNFGRSFKERVEEELDKKGLIDTEYEVGSLTWGKWVEGAANKVIEHKGEYYMRYYNSDETPSVEYYIDGVKASDEELETIKSFLPSKKSSSKQEEVGLEKKEQVFPLVVNFDNIVKIKIGEEEYNIL